VSDCAASLESARHSLESGLDEQIVLVDLYSAANSLGLLTGAITRNDVFAQIFGKFCIGK
jgi:tRNA U34 5-carboxymethylaminomethyl modifying GTPase MnmE/TrmE